MNGPTRAGSLPGFVVLLAVAIWLTVPQASQQTESPDLLALVGGRIYVSPEEPPIANGTVLVRDGRIVAVGAADDVTIPEGATKIDCSEGTVTAGFWNSHVHFTEPKWMDADRLDAARLGSQLEAMLTRYGVVHVFDTTSLLSNTLALKRRIDGGEIAGPHILTAGLALYPPDGVPYYVREDIDPALLGHLPQPRTPEEAVQFVRANLADGADAVKLFVASWVERGKTTPMTLDVVQAAVAEAHRVGKPVIAHPSLVEGVELALEGGVDILAHTIEDPDHWTPQLARRLQEAGVALIPTLKLLGQGDDSAGVLNEVKTVADAGGEILFGTDVGFLTDYDPTMEYILLARAGLTPRQILDTLTAAPARRLGGGRTRGVVAVDEPADLVVLDGDPEADVRVFARVRHTIRDGRVIYSSGAASEPDAKEPRA